MQILLILHGALTRFYLREGINNGIIKTNPLKGSIAAISVGLIAGEQILDLCYDEDSRADLDFNIVMTGNGDIVEVQGTAEGEPFSKGIMQDLVELAEIGINHHLTAQKTAIAQLQIK